MRNTILTKFLDASIFWSFDRSGYLRHKQDFRDAYQFEKGSRSLITGGTSGIGEAVARELEKHGVDVTVSGRNTYRGDALVNFKKLDMSEWSTFDAFVDQIAPLDHLVLNAGGMPENFQTNAAGVEREFASQLFGHYILAKKLLLAKKLKNGARIVWVTSGGMYLKALDTETILRNDRYDKVDNYANVKRAQVTLLPFFRREFPKQVVTAMHPGWAATPGVANALPTFSKAMKNRLRSPLEGADTILWLLGTSEPTESGGLYFDRKKVATHLFPFTRKGDRQTNALENLLLQYFKKA